MSKLYLFNLLLILLLLSMEQINSTGINHSNQKSSASIFYVNEPPPGDLKAGPLDNRKYSENDRKEIIKNILQRYVVTTGVPTIETVYDESSTLTPKLKSISSDDNPPTEHNLGNSRNNQDNHQTDVSIKTPTEHNHRNERFPNGRIKSKPDELQRYTNKESQKDDIDATPEFQKGISPHSFGSDSLIPSIVPHYQTSTVYPIYYDPILAPGVHSTPLSSQHSTLAHNGKTYIDDSSRTVYLDDSKSFQSSSKDDCAHSPQASHYNSHSNPNYLHQQVISSSTMHPEIPLSISTDFKQTHRIVNHQPVSGTENVQIQRLNYGDHISTPGQFYLPQPTTMPISVYHHQQQTIQHVPAVTEIPVTEIQDHNGVIHKTINVPQHSIQTKTYEVRRPAIQKQFYDIEERVVVKPAGSVVVEIDQPITKTSTGHLSTKIGKTPVVGNGQYLSPSPTLQHYNPPQQHIPPPQHIPTQHISAQYIPTQHNPEQHIPVPHIPAQHTPEIHIPHDAGNGSHIITSPIDRNFTGDHYLPPEHDSNDGTTYINDHTEATSSKAGTTLSDYYKINNVPHYSVPIGSAVTTTQTSAEDEAILVNVKNSEKYVDSLRKHAPAYSSSLRNLEILSRIQDNNKRLPEQQNAPQMIAKGEPDFSRPPFVQIKYHEEPIIQNKYIPQKSPANTLYALQSVINNNLHTLDNKQQTPINNIYTNSRRVTYLQGQQNSLHNKNNNNSIQQQQKSSSKIVEIADVQQISPNNNYNNQQQRKSSAQIVQIAHVQPVAQSNLQNGLHFPKIGTPIPFIVYAISSGSKKNADGTKSQENNAPTSAINRFNDSKFNIEHSNPYLQSEKFKSNPKNADQNIGNDSQGSPSHISFIVSSTTPSADYTQNRLPMDENYNKASSSQNLKNIIDPLNSETQYTENPRAQTVSYTQVPTVTYHIRTNQQDLPDFEVASDIQPAFFNSPDNNNNFIKHEESNNNNEHVLAAYQNQLPPIYKNQPCDKTLLITEPQQFTKTYTTSPNLHTTLINENGHYQSGSVAQKFQNSNQESNIQFIGQSEFTQQEYLSPSSQHPQKLDVGAQHYHHQQQQVPHINNHQNKYQQQQQQDSIIQNPVIYSEQKNNYQQFNNKRQEINHNQPQVQYFPPKSSQTFIEANNKQQNVVNYLIRPQSNNYNVDHIDQNGGEKSEHSYFDRENSQHIRTHEKHQQLYSNNPRQHFNQASINNQQSNIQYYPANSKLRYEPNSNNVNYNKHVIQQNNNSASGLTGNIQNAKQNFNPNNNKNSAIAYQKTNTDENSNTHQTIADKNENIPNFSELRITADDQQQKHHHQNNINNDVQIYRFKNNRTHSAIKDTEISPTHSYFHVTNNLQPRDSNISFQPLTNQSQSRILQHLLSNKGKSAQPIRQTAQILSNEHHSEFEAINTRVVSATPASQYAQVIGEKINTKRIVVNQPIETVQVVEEKEPITTYRQVTVQEPIVYKTQTYGVKKVGTSIPVLVSQPSIYSTVPIYQGHEIGSTMFLEHGSIPSNDHENYSVLQMGTTHSIGKGHRSIQTIQQQPIAVHQY